MMAHHLQYLLLVLVCGLSGVRAAVAPDDSWLLDWAFQSPVDQVSRSTERSILWPALAASRHGPLPPFIGCDRSRMTTEQLKRIKVDVKRTIVFSKSERDRLTCIVIAYLQAHPSHDAYIQGMSMVVASVMRAAVALSDEAVFHTVCALLDGVNDGYDNAALPSVHTQRLLHYSGIPSYQILEKAFQQISTITTAVDQEASFRVLDIALVFGRGGVFAFHVALFRGTRELIHEAMTADPGMLTQEAYPSSDKRQRYMAKHIDKLVSEARMVYTKDLSGMRKMADPKLTWFEIAHWDVWGIEESEVARFDLWKPHPVVRRFPDGEPSRSVMVAIEMWQGRMVTGPADGGDRMRRILYAYYVLHPAAEFNPIIGHILSAVTTYSPEAVPDTVVLGRLIGLVDNSVFGPFMCDQYMEFVHAKLTCTAADLFPIMMTDCPLLLPFTVKLPPDLAIRLLDIAAVLGDAGWMAIYLHFAKSIESPHCGVVHGIAGRLLKAAPRPEAHAERILAIYAAMRPEMEEFILTGRIPGTDRRSDTDTVSMIRPVNSAASPGMVKIVFSSTCIFTYTVSTGEIVVLEDTLVPEIVSRPCAIDGGGGIAATHSTAGTLLPEMTAVKCDKEWAYLTCYLAVGTEVVELHRRTHRGPLQCDSVEGVKKECGLLIHTYWEIQAAAAMPLAHHEECSPSSSGEVDAQTGCDTHSDDHYTDRMRPGRIH